VDVPVQYFQSVIAIEVAITGALLFQIRFFDRDEAAGSAGHHRADPRVLLVVAVVLTATVFGSLAAMLHDAGTTAASAVSVGLAISFLPILLRVLPPLARSTRTQGRDPDPAWTVVGLLLYLAIVAGLVVLLNV
jgi:glucose-6-phosphate-specific signal transduction histidine kinase